VIGVPDSWSDDELLGALAAAFREADAVPRDFVEAGRTAFAWHGIEAELAELAYDSDLQRDDLAALTRADTAVLRALTFVSAELTIEIEVTQGALLGQIVPPQPGEVGIRTRSGRRSDVPIDEVGCFAVHEVPAEPFRLHCRTSAGCEVRTTWVTL
jgi:hypothetical protein